MSLIEEAVAAGARRHVAAEMLGLTVRTLQRWARQGLDSEDQRRGPRTAPAHKLTPAERLQLLEMANCAEYRDLSPKQIVPRMADEHGLYLGSESTLYRILREEKQLTHRQRSRPATHHRPQEHPAHGPNEVWSWDISWLPSPIRGRFFYLYLIMDVWSRKIMAAHVYERESPELASQLFASTCQRLKLDPDGLVLHADNGHPMKGSTMVALLDKLGVRASFSRPHVSDDNPYSEALFRTLKFRPEYPPQAFASLQHAQTWVKAFVEWYNSEHRHSAIRYVTPNQRHDGSEKAILQRRRQIWEKARKKHPQRWSRHTRDWTPVATVTLNPDRKHSHQHQAP